MAKMKSIRTIAEEEIRLEKFREEVEREKARIRRHVPFWQRLLPFTITIKRRNKHDD